MRGGPVRHHRHLPEVPLHLFEISDEGGRVKLLVRPEKLPTIPSDGPVYHDLAVASGVRHDYPLSARGPIFAPGYHIVDKERLVLVHYGKSVPLQA